MNNRTLNRTVKFGLSAVIAMASYMGDAKVTINTHEGFVTHGMPIITGDIGLSQAEAQCGIGYGCSGGGGGQCGIGYGCGGQ